MGHHRRVEQGVAWGQYLYRLYWADITLCGTVLKGQFLEINIQHVYRELNTDADHLSKKAILRPVGQFLVARGDGLDPSEFSIFGSY